MMICRVRVSKQRMNQRMRFFFCTLVILPHFSVPLQQPARHKLFFPTTQSEDASSISSSAMPCSIDRRSFSIATTTLLILPFVSSIVSLPTATTATEPLSSPPPSTNQDLTPPLDPQATVSVERIEEGLEEWWDENASRMGFSSTSGSDVSDMEDDGDSASGLDTSSDSESPLEDDNSESAKI